MTHEEPSSAVGTRSTALPRRRFFDEMPDKGLFAGVAVIGFIGIILLKIYTVPANIVAAFAVILMMLYGFVAYRIRAVHIRLDRLGDNFYYLGFIYTLASMSAALTQLQTTIDVKAILGSFGIALVTTIVGIAGRVVFVQMRSELEDAEAIIRRDILVASSELKGQLSAALQDFETFRVAVRQSLAEDAKASGEANKALLEQIAALASATAQRIDAILANDRARADELNRMIMDTSRALNLFTNQIAAVDFPGGLERRLAAFVDALDRYVARLGSAVEEVGRAARNQRRRRIWRWLSRPFSRQLSPGG